MSYLHIITSNFYRKNEYIIRKSRTQHFMHCACILYRGQPVVITLNNEKCHAEKQAINKWNRHPTYDKRLKIDLFVFRISTSGQKLCESKPCLNCTQFIKTHNINWVFYSTSDGTVLREKANRLHTTHISKGFRKLG